MTDLLQLDPKPKQPIPAMLTRIDELKDVCLDPEEMESAKLQQVLKETT